MAVAWVMFAMMACGGGKDGDTSGAVLPGGYHETVVCSPARFRQPGPARVRSGGGGGDVGPRDSDTRRACGDAGVLPFPEPNFPRRPRPNPRPLPLRMPLPLAMRMSSAGTTTG